MHLHNADVVKKFIFRYLSVLLTDGLWNIFMNITNKDIPNKIIELTPLELHAGYCTRVQKRKISQIIIRIVNHWAFQRG
jgi:hypothetical protein